MLWGLPCCLDLEGAKIRPPVVFDHVQFFAVRHALSIQPGLVVEPDRIDDKRIALPPGDGISHPQRLEIFRMSAAVEKELPVAVNITFIENDNERWSLYEFLRERRDSRNTGRQAMPFRIVFAEIRAALLI